MLSNLMSPVWSAVMLMSLQPGNTADSRVTKCWFPMLDFCHFRLKTEQKGKNHERTVPTRLDPIEFSTLPMPSKTKFCVKIPGIRGVALRMYEAKFVSIVS